MKPRRCDETRLGAWVRRVILYWMDRAAWHTERCEQGHHAWLETGIISRKRTYLYFCEHCPASEWRGPYYGE